MQTFMQRVASANYGFLNNGKNPDYGKRPIQIQAEMEKARLDSDYQRDADTLCARLGVRVVVRYLGYFRHFDSDKECRDVYEFTIERDGKATVGPWRFGQSLMYSVADRPNVPKFTPTAYDVLSCMPWYEPESFEDWASEMGFEKFSDYPKARVAHDETMNQYKGLRQMFTEDERRELSETCQ